MSMADPVATRSTTAEVCKHIVWTLFACSKVSSTLQVAYENVMCWLSRSCIGSQGALSSQS